MKFPFQSLIQLKRDSEVPLFLQIANAIILGIKQGIIRPGSKLPSTRELATTLKIHRNTAIAAFEELSDQGWLKVIPPKGTFVSKTIPEIVPKKLIIGSLFRYPEETGYPLKLNTILEKRPPYTFRKEYLEFDEGLPDVRMAPILELNRAYRSVAKRTFTHQDLSYTDINGNKDLRIVLSNYLNTTRGLRTSEKNIFITRGSQMALYLTITALISVGDNVVVGDTNYFLVDKTLLNAGAKIIRIPVDDLGIDTDALERVCKKKKIRAIYVTPHHHYPTTVTLNSERRVKLLALAEQFKFCIIEDDYDFDFHYSSSPILPLASADTKGMVVYIGSLFKSIAPAIRIGYIAAPITLIDEASKLRRVIDIQGDSILEQAVAELMRGGEIKRHMKKAVMEYHKRRDVLCGLLRTKLQDEITFRVPDGGMAIWARFDKGIDLAKVSQDAFKKNLIISNGSHHNTGKQNLNATRLGFASLTPEEIEQSVQILAQVFKH